MNWITSILKILSELVKPFAMWWGKKQVKDEIGDEIDWIKKRDRWRRKAEELRMKWQNAMGPDREKYFKDWITHINSDIF